MRYAPSDPPGALRRCQTLPTPRQPPSNPLQLPVPAVTLLKAWMNHFPAFSKGREFPMASGAAALRMIMTDPINEALVLYTGFGNSPFPRAKTPALSARFGETAGP